MTTLRRNDKGFTLMEVLISIVMVGILFLPLLSVFSKSMGANNVSRNIQRANAVAASVAEQVRAYDTFSDMCNVGSTGGSNLVLTASSGGVYSFSLTNLKSDGVDYTANIQVDYTKYSNLNAKGLPQISSLGGGSSVMAYEKLNSTDTVIAAYANKYQSDFHKSISSDAIAKALKKTVMIEITDTELDGSGKNMIPEGNVHVSVYTKYSIDASRATDSDLKTYAGASAVRTDTLYDENVVLEKLKGIYIFFSYDIANGVDIFQGIDVEMNLQQSSSKDDLHNIILYSLCQGIDDVVSSSGKLTGNDMYTYADNHHCHTVISRNGSVPSGAVKDYISVFSNFPAEVDGILQAKNDMDSIVSSEAMDRLAKVTITVYRDGEECGKIETTRGE